MDNNQVNSYIYFGSLLQTKEDFVYLLKNWVSSINVMEYHCRYIISTWGCIVPCFHFMKRAKDEPQEMPKKFIFRGNKKGQKYLQIRCNQMPTCNSLSSLPPPTDFSCFSVVLMSGSKFFPSLLLHNIFLIISLLTIRCYQITSQKILISFKIKPKPSSLCA